MLVKEFLFHSTWELFEMRVSEIRVNQIRVNQGLCVILKEEKHHFKIISNVKLVLKVILTWRT